MPFRSIVAYLVLVFVSATHVASAQTFRPIRFLEKSKIFVLDAGSASYVFGINEQNALQLIYGAAMLRATRIFSRRTAPTSGLRLT